MAGQHSAVDDRTKVVAVEARRRRRTDHFLGRADGRDQALERQRLQLIDLQPREPKLYQHRVGKLGGALALSQPNGRPAHDDGAVEQAARGRHGEQGAHLPASARLAEDRHVAGIAAEARDVLAHPLQRGDHVEGAGVAGVGKAFAREIGEMQMAEDVEPLVDRHHDHVVVCSKARPVEPRHVGGAERKGAAVVPDHDRTLAAVGKPARPQVQGEAILALGNRVARTRQAGQFRPLLEARRELRRVPGPIERIAHPGPRLGLLRRHETIAAAGRCAIGHASESIDPIDRSAADFPRGGLGDRRVGRNHARTAQACQHCHTCRLRSPSQKRSTIEARHPIPPAAPPRRSAPRSGRSARCGGGARSRIRSSCRRRWRRDRRRAPPARPPRLSPARRSRRPD